MGEPLTWRETLESIIETIEEREAATLLGTDQGTVSRWRDGSREPTDFYRRQIFSLGEIVAKILKIGGDRALSGMLRNYTKDYERSEN